MLARAVERPRLHHQVPGIPAAFPEHVEPDDQLGVPGLVLDGDEHRDLLPLAVLQGDGLTRHQDFLSFTGAVHGSGLR